MTLKYPLSQASIEEINAEFVQSYDHKHWWYKLKTYNTLINHTEEFVENYGDEFQDEPLEEYRLSLKSEVIFTYYHISEALFSLIICRNAAIPWIYMKHLRFSEICDFVRDNLLDGASKRNVAATFYPQIGEEEWKDENGQLFESVSFIQEYLRRMGAVFLENDVYSEYKHGLRLIAAESGFQIGLESEKTDETIARHGSTHIYLQENENHRDGNDVYYDLKRVVKSFDYELYYRLCLVNYHLVDQLFRVSRQQQDTEDNVMRIRLFDEVKVDAVFEEDVHGKFTLKRKYASGEKMYEIS